MKGKKTKILLKIIALEQSKRLGSQVKRVRSTSDLSAKIDELAKAVAIAGGNSCNCGCWSRWREECFRSQGLLQGVAELGEYKGRDWCKRVFLKL